MCDCWQALQWLTNDSGPSEFVGLVGRVGGRMGLAYENELRSRRGMMGLTSARLKSSTVMVVSYLFWAFEIVTEKGVEDQDQMEKLHVQQALW